MPAVLPPAAAPSIVNLRVNQEGSSDIASLISWESDVPVSVTPLGPHVTTLEAVDAAGNILVRARGQVDALTNIPSPAAMPPPDPVEHVIYRYDEEGAVPRFYAWGLRPAADQPFHASVAMIDPLGRVSRAEADVPPLSP